MWLGWSRSFEVEKCWRKFARWEGFTLVPGAWSRQSESEKSIAFVVWCCGEGGDEDDGKHQGCFTYGILFSGVRQRTSFKTFNLSNFSSFRDFALLLEKRDDRFFCLQSKRRL
jgi:hypothetical protein